MKILNFFFAKHTIAELNFNNNNKREREKTTITTEFIRGIIIIIIIRVEQKTKQREIVYKTLKKTSYYILCVCVFL